MWLWATLITITLLLTIGLASFVLFNSHFHRDFYLLIELPRAVRGIVGLLILFDLYTIHRHLPILQIHRELREDLRRLKGGSLWHYGCCLIEKTKPWMLQ